MNMYNVTVDFAINDLTQLQTYIKDASDRLDSIVSGLSYDEASQQLMILQ